jgi:hypothetical protein
MLRRFWFEFQFPEGEGPFGTRAGCGVTAYDLEDARRLLRERVFHGELPPTQRVVEDVDVSTLDLGHVLPNMYAPTQRGIWFPMGYDHPY